MAHYSVSLDDGTKAEFDAPNANMTKEQIQGVIAARHPKASTWKQAASGVGRFGLETGGMIGGGMLGGLTSEVTGPVGPIVGAGMGSAAGTAAADKLTQALGLPIPKGSKAKRYGISGLMGAGGETAGQALGAVARTAPVQEYLAEKAPKLMKLFTDTPEEFTKLKLSEKSLPKVTAEQSTKNYAKNLERIGITKDVNSDIDRLAESFGKGKTKGDVASLEAQKILSNLTNPGKGVNPGIKATPLNTSNLSQLLNSSATDVSSLSSEGVAKNASDLRTLQNIAKTPELIKQYDPKELVKESLNLRHNIDAKINYEPSTGSEKALSKHYQGTLKAMRKQTQDLIESIPGGDVVRQADKQMQKEMAGREFSTKFKPPKFRGKGGIAQLGGLGFAPFLVSRMTGIPMGLTYGAAIASRSPAAMGALLKGVENPGTYSQPIYQLLRLLRDKEKKSGQTPNP